MSKFIELVKCQLMGNRKLESPISNPLIMSYMIVENTLTHSEANILINFFGGGFCGGRIQHLFTLFQHMEVHLRKT